MTYKIHWCWNGDKRQIDGTDTFENRREWRHVIDNMPYDIIDESDSECWVDYGDCDDFEGTWTVANGTTYTLHMWFDGETGRTIWTADNFGYWEPTRDELIDSLEWWTHQWDVWAENGVPGQEDDMSEMHDTITDETFTCDDSELRAELLKRFPDAPKEVVDAIDGLVNALMHGEPTDAYESYLGIEVNDPTE